MARRRGQRKGYLRPEHGSWLLTYRVYLPNGKSQRETVTIGPAEGAGRLTEKQAERFAWDHYLGKVDQIAQQPRSMISVGDFWEKHYKPAALLKLKKSTREQYFSLYGCWIKPIIASKRLGTLEPGDVEQAISAAVEGGVSPATSKHVRKVISAMWTKAKKLKLVSGDNPASLADVPKPQPVREKIALSVEQMSTVLSALKEPERTMALAAVLTSMNISELCGLRWKHVNLTGQWVTLDDEAVPPLTIAVREHFTRQEYGSLKATSRKRNIPIPPALLSDLARLKARPKFIEAEDVVFCSSKGTPLSENNTRKRKLAPIAAKIGVKRLSWHVFRYTHATLTKSIGMSDRDRQALMGHASIEMTDRYTAEDYNRMRSGMQEIAGMMLVSTGPVM